MSGAEEVPDEFEVAGESKDATEDGDGYYEDDFEAAESPVAVDNGGYKGGDAIYDEAPHADEGKSSSRKKVRKVRRRRKKKKGKKKKKKKVPASASSSIDGFGDDMYGDHDYPEYRYDDGEEYEDEILDKYAAVRRESARIMSKRFMERHEVKRRIIRERQRSERRIANSKKKMEHTWRKKMERSPFMVDLIAENERIDEENQVRIEEEARRERMLNKRKVKIKNEIILKALSESSDLEALRREKRLIAEEEKRLKALLLMEKANSHTKADLMAAQRAERQRKQVQSQYRRERLREEHASRRELETQLLREKLAIKEDEAFTYFSRTLG